MSSTKALTSPALITKAEAASGAIEEVIRKAGDDWNAAYLAVAKDRKSATAQAIADSLPAGSGCKSPATVTDMERAARIAHPDAWAALWRLPVAANGARVITLHGLIAKARKSAKAAAVDAAIGKALDAVAQAQEADEDKRGARIARAYSGLVGTLNTLKPPAAPPVEPDEDQEPDQEPAATVEREEDQEPPTIDGRVLALAEECARLRAILTGGGASVKRESLAALVREAGELSRDVSRILDAHAAKRAAS